MHPDFVTTPATPKIGFIHRHLESGDFYFVANTTNRAVQTDAAFRASGSHAELWDPFTGKFSGVSDPEHMHLDLAPYESRLIFFANASLTPVRPPLRIMGQPTDISHDWSISFAGESQAKEMPSLSSWSDDPQLRYYSGQATYRKVIDISPSAASPSHSVVIDFGEGTPTPLPTMPVEFNMRAYLDSPVREAAQVYVNDQLAGCVWHPPFRLDLTPFIKPGKNELRIVVGNTAINELAGTALPNYRLLHARYGTLFEPQGMQDLQPLPSGILGKVTLIETAPPH